jgi:DNA (cytosine-5)-methyltransferase 1
MESKLKLAEFCAGTGAFSLVFEKTNLVETIFANDYEPNSEKIFNENFTIKLKCCDINLLNSKKDIPKHDILTSGFPCQPFSIAGKQEGFDDERSNVFWKLIEIIKIHKPRVVIFENVKNLESHDDGNTFNTITSEIKKINYHYKHKILNTCDITPVPQNRERIYIVCFKNKDDCDRFEFPEAINNKDKKNLIDFMDKKVDKKYYYSDKLKVWEEINTNVTKNISTNTIYQYRRYYVRENKNSVCPTLTANMGCGGHNVPLLKDNDGIRKLTPKECFNLQGFPTTYKFPKISDSALYKLAGNAVSVPVVEKLVLNIMKALKLEIPKNNKKEENIKADQSNNNTKNETNNSKQDNINNLNIKVDAKIKTKKNKEIEV